MKPTRSAVLENIDQVLVAHGFTRDRTSWTRTSGDYIDIVDVQYGRHDPRFTLNLGVFEPTLYSVIWKERPSPLIAACGVVECRIGHLINDRDTWWGTKEQTPEDRLVIRNALNDYGMHYFATNHSSEDLIRTLEAGGAVKNMARPGLIYWAMLMREIGRDEACEAKLNELLDRYQDPWRRTIKEALVAKQVR